MPIPAVLGTVVAIIRAMWQLKDYIESITHPEPATIRELYNRMNAVEIQVRQLETDVANLTYELRRGEVIEITRDVDAQRAAVSGALLYAADHKGDTASELTALVAAIALASDSFYTFPGRTAESPDRYDPRVALPSFIEAVNAWILLRSYNGTAWTTTSRDSLKSFATTLENLINRIRANIVCVEVFQSYDHPLAPPPKPRFPPRKLDPNEDPPPPPPTEPRCHYDVEVFDLMAVTNTLITKSDSHGYCGREGQWLFEPGKSAYLSESYQPDKLSEIVAFWRKLAS